MKEAKFKVGDRVIGNEKANSYNITREGWKGIVTGIFTLLEPCDYITCKGEEEFFVNSECFDFDTSDDFKVGDRAICNEKATCNYYEVIDVRVTIKHKPDPLGVRGWVSLSSSFGDKTYWLPAPIKMSDIEGKTILSSIKVALDIYKKHKDELKNDNEKA